MAEATLERNSFVRGLITEATPLTFPENALLDEKNFVLNRDGSLQRRLGMDYETNHALIDTTKVAADFGSLAITSFKWENVGDDATVAVGVVQVGNKLHLLDLREAAPSGNVLQTITLATKYNNSPLQYAAIKGVLVLVSSEDADGPQFLEREDNGTFTLGFYSLSVRDIWGVEDGLAVDQRPALLTEEHRYNLLNQGWLEANYNAVAFPSNADVMQFGKDSGDNFSKAQLDKQFFGNSPAAKGKFIINAYFRGINRQLRFNGTTLLEDNELGRATTVAAYAGRAFYSGVNSKVEEGDGLSPSYTGTIFFTQLIKNKNDLGKCYQEADPTSEHISDLLATDGGVIDIPEASNIYKLITRETSLVVLAENGVWEITGPDGVFRADDFSISKITNAGVQGRDSVINAEQSIMYWSDAGIYVLAPNTTTGRLVAQNLSENTIQTLYTEIPSLGRANSKGNYDSSSRKVSWLYNDTDMYDGTTQASQYNKELIFDVVLNAFYTHEIGSLETDSPFVAGYMPVSEFITIQKTDNVVVNGVNVLVNGEQVVVTSDVRSSVTDSKTKYITITPAATYTLTLSNYGNANFLDWEAADTIGIDSDGYLITGYELFADSQRRKFLPYLSMHFRRTEVGFVDVGGGSLDAVNPSSCMVQAQWDFANSENSGKWGSPFQAYRLSRPYFPVDDQDTFDYGFVMITTRNRVRGSGKAISLRMDTEAGHDCHIYGWAMAVEGNENV